MRERDVRAYVRCFNIFTKLKIAKLIFTGTVILFAGAGDATADIDAGEEPGSKKTRLESDYDELLGPHYTTEKKGLVAPVQRR